MLTKNLLLSCPTTDCLVLDNGSPLSFTKEVIYVDSFTKWAPDGQVEYRFSVDESQIDNWIKNHNEMIEAGLEVPMPETHTALPSAKRAKAIKLSKRVDSKGRLGLFVHGEFLNQDYAKALAKSQVSLYSPPVVRHQDKVFTAPIQHICFTDYPVVGDLDPLTIAASNEPLRKPMKLTALAAALGLSVLPEATDDQLGIQIQEAYKALQVEAAKPAVTSTVTVAASNDAPELTAQVNTLVLDNRSLKIDKLVSEYKISTAEAKQLRDEYCAPAISLSNDHELSFSTVVKLLSGRDPIKALGSEKTGAQKRKTEDSPLMAAIKGLKS